MSPPLHIHPCTPSDAPELARAQHTIFQSPIYRTIYAAVSPSAQLAKFERTIAASLAEQQSPTTPGGGGDSSRQVTWLKCTTTTPSPSPSEDENETPIIIIAYITWLYLPNGYSPSTDTEAQVAPDDMPRGTNMPLIEEFYRLARDMRAEHHPGPGRPHYLLSILGTLPGYERRGAATALIRWGVERADERGVPCYVDSSAVGVKLYERMGFVECGEMEVDLGAFGGEGEGVQRWVAMRREPVGRVGGESV